MVYDANRVISARAEFEDTHIEFTEHTLINNYNVGTVDQHLTKVVGDWIYHFVREGSVLKWCRVADILDDRVYQVIPVPLATSVDVGIGISEFGDKLFYWSRNKTGDGTYIAHIDINALPTGTDSTTLGRYELGANFPLNITIHPHSWSDFSITQIVDGYIEFKTYSAQIMDYNPIYTWNARLYQEPGDVRRLFNVVAFFSGKNGNRDYTYLWHNNCKSGFYTARSGYYWSELQPIIPLDVSDDMTEFELCGKYTCVNRPNPNNGTLVYLIGRMKRSESDFDHLVYLKGPDQVGLGRELIIAKYTDQLYEEATFIEIGGQVVYDCFNKVYTVPSRGIFTSINSDVGIKTSTDLFNFSISKAIDSPGAINAELPNDYTDQNLVAGGDATIYATINDVEYKLGKFNIDGVVLPDDGASRATTIRGTESVMKRLSQWESDAPYDIWSQTKLVADGGDMGSLIKATGHPDFGDKVVGTKYFNEDVILYTSAKASKGGIVSAEFSNTSSNINTFCGVALNFYQETKGQAAARLEIDYDEVEEDQYGVNGIFAIMDRETVKLYFVRDNVWTLLGSQLATGLDRTGFKLMLSFKDGLIKVWFRNTSTATWTLLLTNLFTPPAGSTTPWKRAELSAGDEVGRAAVLIKNNTYTSTCYPFSASDTYIPVDDVSGFLELGDFLPAPWDHAFAQIGDEIIEYQERSSNRKVEGLTVSAGKVGLAHNATPTGHIVFADHRERNYLLQSISNTLLDKYATGIRLYVGKQNYPEDNLVVSLTSGIERPPTGQKPIGTRYITKNIPSEDLSEDGGWVTVLFDKPVQIRTGTSILLYRSENPSNPTPENYYKAFVSSSPGYSGGALETFDDEHDTYTPKTGDLLFEILTSPVDPPTGGYNIMVNTIPALLTSDNSYRYLALTVLSGGGIGTTYEITGYKYDASVSTFYVDKKPNKIKAGDEVKVVPTLMFCDRGIQGTSAIAHGSEKIDWRPEDPAVLCKEVTYFSNEIDHSIGGMASQIANKAGVTDLNVHKTTYYVDPNSSDPNLSTVDIGDVKGKIIYVTGNIYNFNGGLTFTINDGQVEVEVGATHFIVRDNLSGTLELKERIYSLDTDFHFIHHWFAVSFHEDQVSVWVDGEFFYGTRLHFQDDIIPDYFNTVLGGYSDYLFEVTIEEAGARVDNFLLDTGVKGLSLIDQLIGQKRVYYYQGIDDDALHIYTERETINSEEDPYDRAITTSLTLSDNTVATRLRVEGGDIYENYDEEAIKKYGNIYREINLNEVYTKKDAIEFSEKILEDMISRGKVRDIYGQADPRVMPGKYYYVKVLNQERTHPVIEKLIVDSVSFSMTVSDSDASFDMELSGRVVETIDPYEGIDLPL